MAKGATCGDAAASRRERDGASWVRKAEAEDGRGGVMRASAWLIEASSSRRAATSSAEGGDNTAGGEQRRVQGRGCCAGGQVLLRVRGAPARSRSKALPDSGPNAQLCPNYTVFRHCGVHLEGCGHHFNVLQQVLLEASAGLLQRPAGGGWGQGGGGGGIRGRQLRGSRRGARGGRG